MSRRMLVSTRNLSISYLFHEVLTDLSFSVSGGEVVAIVGANGCGKSTLLKTLLHTSLKDRPFFIDNDITVSGAINFGRDVVVSYLPQHLRNEVTPGCRLAPSSPAAYGLEARLRSSFGLEKTLRETDRMSDGELQKAATIETLAADADLYLLDEPTNYLDIGGLTAFEDYLDVVRARGRGILLVTHDRTLTDNLADRTIYLSVNGIYQTVGGFEQAWSVQAEDFRARQHQAAQIRRKIGDLQEDMRRKAAWADKKEKQKTGAKGAKAHIGRLAKKLAARSKTAALKADREIEKLKQTKPFIPKTINLRFPPYTVRHRTVFDMRKLAFDYAAGTASESTDPETPLLREITLSASTRDKICLMGANGTGKSTILKLILGQLKPHHGSYSLNESVSRRYLPQGLVGFFENRVLLENFRSCGQDETTVRRYLGAALIRKEKPESDLGQFSYGELMRAAVVKCILERAEFMILDEPTSHLDIESIEVLEHLLNDFPGGYIIVSHDRTFVENVSGRLLSLEDGRLRLV